LYFLKQAFPQLNPANTGFPDVDLNTSNKVLVFFLTGGPQVNYRGFANNARFPYLPPSANNSRKGPYLEVQRDKHLDASGWELIDPFGNPYVYFSARRKAYPDVETGSNLVTGYADQSGTVQKATVGAVTILPYRTSTDYVLPKGFQIISAGRDGVFGPGGMMPATGNPGGEDDQAQFSPRLLSSGLTN
jgi:hypothetical protein